jgi:chemotaxis signal transduction protein
MHDTATAPPSFQQAQTVPAPLAMAPTQALAGDFDLGAAAGLLPGTPAQATQDQRRQGFVVGGLRLMTRYDEGSELAEIPTIYRLPNVPSWFLGFTNLQGVLVPVFDLARYLGLGGQKPARPLLLVLSHGANAAGVVIDGLPRRLRYAPGDQTQLDAAPPKVVPYLRGACLIDDQPWFDLDANALLDTLARDMETSS